MVRINLALQGGGAHGAFTWGVLDRILEDDSIEIASISGTSAGALNGAALKSGMIRGGREGARENLDWLWEQMGAHTNDLPHWMHPWMPNPGMVSKSVEYSVPFVWGEAFRRIMSPYAWGPAYRNPLEKLVDKFDFERICSEEGPQFFVGATQVRSGKIRVFTGDEITTQSILASACLPTMFQAVELPDPNTGVIEAFWDGGYTGNPPLFPFFNKNLPDDIVVVNINPLHRDEVPITPPEILNRINEISFNSSLFRELRAIEFVQRLLGQGALQPGSMKNVRVHMIADDALMSELSVATKTVPVPSVLNQLKEAGRRAAGNFLESHKSDLGERQTTDLREMFE